MNKKLVMGLLLFTSLLTAAEAWAHRPAGVGGEILASALDQHCVCYADRGIGDGLIWRMVDN